MASQSTIFHDERYWEFVDAYHAITPENAKASVVSGTSTGKTASFARIALWPFLKLFGVRTNQCHYPIPSLRGSHT